MAENKERMFDEDDAVPIGRKKRKNKSADTDFTNVTYRARSKSSAAPSGASGVSRTASGTAGSNRTVNGTQGSGRMTGKTDKTGSERLNNSERLGDSERKGGAGYYGEYFAEQDSPNSAESYKGRIRPQGGFAEENGKSGGERDIRDIYERRDNSVYGDNRADGERNENISNDEYGYDDADDADDEDDEEYSMPYRGTPRMYKNSKGKKKRHIFRYFYLTFAAILLVLSVAAVIYVHGVLKEYESAQPDSVAEKYAEEIKSAAKKGKIESVLSFDSIRNELEISEEDIRTFEKEIAQSDLTYKKAANSDSMDTLNYKIMCGDYTVARFSMKSVSQVTKLAILTYDVWQVSDIEAAGYGADIKLPSSVSVTVNGKKIEGAPSDDGNTLYTVRSVTMPEIMIEDSVGNSVKYSDDGKYDFKQYRVCVPSNFVLSGKEDIPLSLAEVSEDETYVNIEPFFSDMPRRAVYNLYIMDGEYSLKILDNTGKEVDVSDMGTNIEILSQTGLDSMPQGITSPPDPLEIAKLWSNFMTDDIGGARHGFNTMAQYLISGTPQYERAREWAGSIDITFISAHTLLNPPFTTAEADNFVFYNDKCFSCEILLEKPLKITTGDIVDKIHSTFFFGFIDDTDDGVDNPHWGIVDISGITS